MNNIKMIIEKINEIETEELTEEVIKEVYKVKIKGVKPFKVVVTKSINGDSYSEKYVENYLMLEVLSYESKYREFNGLKRDIDISTFCKVYTNNECAKCMNLIKIVKQIHKKIKRTGISDNTLNYFMEVYDDEGVSSVENARDELLKYIKLFKEVL